MNVETIVFDMDGTILNDKKELDPVLKKISPLLQAQGKRLMIATGRLAQMTYSYLNELDINQSPLVSCNGAAIGYRDQKQPLYAAKFPLDMITKLVDKAQSLNLLFNLFTLDGLIGKENVGRVAYYSEANKEKEIEDQVPILIGAQYLAPKYLKETIKFLIVAPESSELSAFRTYAEKLGLETVSSGDNLTDVTMKGVTKGSALQRLHEDGIINLNTTMAFGDNDNDVSMLKVVAYPIVMSNGTSAVRALAGDTCDTNENDGVGRYLQKMFLA